nr:cytochrome P450 [Microbispora sitophila]
MFRFESAVTGMKRLVTRDTTLGGVRLRAGEQVFLAYASGSRDVSRFANPDEIDLGRSWTVPHLGFGQGVHTCLGAPLARLLLRVELGVLHERLPGLRLAAPYEELERTVVSEGRGMVALPLSWTPVPVAARGAVQAERRGTDWHLVYLGRSIDRMAYVEELVSRHGARVEAWPSRDRGRLDLDAVWSRLPDREALVYACGPESLLSGLEDSAQRAGREHRLVVERFAPRAAPHKPNRAFEVVLARTGTVVTVAEDGRDRGRGRHRPRRGEPRRRERAVRLQRGNLRHLRDSRPRRRPRAPGHPSSASRNAWPAKR